MRSVGRILAAAGCAVVVVAPAAAAAYVTDSGRVELVVDGDTVQVDIAGDGKSGVHVRNAGIQAMERGQCGSAEATTAHKALVGVGSVVLKSTYASSTSRDGDGRIRPLRYVETPGGMDVQAGLLSRGLVLAYPFGGELARQDAYHLAAQQAALTRVGLWSGTLCGEGPDQDAKIRIWVNWDADGDDSKNISGEYIRVLNEGSEPLNLTGWWVRSPTPSIFRFPSGTTVAPGRYISVRSGTGSNTARDLYWGDSAARFYKPTPEAVHAFGAFLFDPDGDIRSWTMYPCTWGCPETLSTAWNVSWGATYDPPGDDSANPNAETLNLSNTSRERIDVSYRVVTLLGYVTEFGPGTYLDPGETLRVHMGRGSESRLHKYMGRDHALLSNAGGSALIRSTDGFQIGCARWGDGGPASHRCSPTAVRSFDRVELTSVDQGRSVRYQVIPAGRKWAYRLERWQVDAWVVADSGEFPATGTLTHPVPTGRYRLVIPGQLGFRSGVSEPIYVLPTSEGAVGSGPVQPAAWVSNVADRVGMLRVSVRPTLGIADDWRFILQRKSGTAWVAVGSYSTKGAPETREFTYQRSGTYRVVVPARPGYLAALSPEHLHRAPRIGVSVGVAAQSRLVIDAGPSLPGAGNFRLTIQKKSGSVWRNVRSMRTAGAAERVTVNVPKGRYRVVVGNQWGYLGVTSSSRYVRR